MNHYSFRAECMPDVLRFLAAVAKQSFAIGGFTARRVADTPDMACTLETDAYLAPLRSIATVEQDCHVIARSLHPVA